MAKYQKSVDIWKLSDEERAKLQPGQWIHTTGEDKPTGRWAGLRPRCKTSVAAWNGNAARYPEGRAEYFRKIREFALGK